MEKLLFAPHIIEDIIFSYLDYKSFLAFFHISKNIYDFLIQPRMKKLALDRFGKFIYRDEYKLAKFSSDGDIEEARKILYYKLVNVDKSHFVPGTHWFCETNETPLGWAVGNGKPEVVKLLLDNGADPKLPNAHGRTALHIAAYNTDIIMAKLLINAGADANAQITSGWHGVGMPHTYMRHKGDTPLHWAAYGGSETIVKLLLECGANPHGMPGWNTTPLHCSLSSSNERSMAVVRALLDHGTDPNQRDNDGNTPLHIAVEDGNVELCETLVGRRADWNRKNSYNISPKDLNEILCRDSFTFVAKSAKEIMKMFR